MRLRWESHDTSEWTICQCHGQIGPGVPGAASAMGVRVSAQDRDSQLSVRRFGCKSRTKTYHHQYSSILYMAEKWAVGCSWLSFPGNQRCASPGQMARQPRLWPRKISLRVASDMTPPLPIFAPQQVIRNCVIDVLHHRSCICLSEGCTRKLEKHRLLLAWRTAWRLDLWLQTDSLPSQGIYHPHPRARFQDLSRLAVPMSSSGPISIRAVSEVPPESEWMQVSDLSVGLRVRMWGPVLAPG